MKMCWPPVAAEAPVSISRVVAALFDRFWEERMTKRLGTALLLSLLTLASSLAARENSLHNLVGYTLVAASEVDRDQLRKLSDDQHTTITLKNEMAFRFRRLPGVRWPTGSLKANVFVFARSLSDREIEWFRSHSIALPKSDEYQLLIEDATYDVQRLR
jgi:hypothetical protein